MAALLEEPRLGVRILNLSVVSCVLNASFLIFLGVWFDEPAMVVINSCLNVVYVVAVVVFQIWGPTREAIWLIVWSSLVANVLTHIALGGYLWSGVQLMWGIAVTVTAAFWVGRGTTQALMICYFVAAVVLAPLEGELRSLRTQPDLALSVILVVDLFIVTVVLTAPGIVTLVDRVRTEQARSRSLLLNILPASVADRLKATPGNIADPYDCTVVFADLVGFTAHAKSLEPETLVKELNVIFSRFDQLCAENGAEKIKTIGDGYLAVCGLPQRREDHLEAGCDLALSIVEAMPALNADLQTDFQVRVGLHTGKAVAGVIGTTKFSYDVWGETVNLASRLESYGHPGKVTTSATVAARAHVRYRLVPAETVDLKGQGRTPTYWLERAPTSGQDEGSPAIPDRPGRAPVTE